MEMQQSHSNPIEEVWKSIPFYEGLYEASNLGNIRSVDGKTTSSARFDKRVWKQRIIKQKERITRSGRVDNMVTLWKGGKPYYHLVSRLVASAFHGDMLNTKMTVNHIDGNSLNNSAENLEWVTRSENIKLGFECGLFDSIKKPVVVLSEHGDTIRASSRADMDRILNRYNGYTSYTIKKCHDTLVDDSGTTYKVCSK